MWSWGSVRGSEAEGEARWGFGCWSDGGRQPVRHVPWVWPFLEGSFLCRCECGEEGLEELKNVALKGVNAGFGRSGLQTVFQGAMEGRGDN